MALSWAQILQNFVKKHPFPTYDQMIKQLGKPTNNECFCPVSFHSIDMYTKYSSFYHISIKQLYENPNNKILIKKIGLELYEHEGLLAIEMCVHILRKFTAFKDGRIRSALGHSHPWRVHKEMIEAVFQKYPKQRPDPDECFPMEDIEEINCQHRW